MGTVSPTLLNTAQSPDRKCLLPTEVIISDMLVPSLLLLSLLTTTLALPARVIKQRVPKFKNFPIVGLKKTVADEAEATVAASLEEHPRDAREAVSGTVGGEPDLDTLFVEEAVYLTPADRDQRALEQLDQDDDDSFDALFYDEDLETDDNKRAERDGGHHHAPSHRAGRRGQRGGRQNLRSQAVEQDYDYQEERGGRQTGGTGVALGVLSNPPSSDGNYNFKYDLVKIVEEILNNLIDLQLLQR